MANAEDVQRLIQKLLVDAHANITAAEKLAEEHKLSFDFEVAYGMGGTFVGDPDKQLEYSEDGWHASSMSC